MTRRPDQAFRPQVFPSDHMGRGYAALAGPKMLRVDPTGGHAPLRRKARSTSRLLVGWAAAALDGTLSSLPTRRDSLAL